MAATDALRPPVELVILVASAGGLDPLSVVLRNLPRDFPAAVVVQQHLGGHSSVLPTILGERTPHRVDWACDGQFVEPGRVLVCPPGVHIELKPDGSVCLRTVQEPGEQRFDTLLTSVAGSYGARGVGVVLSGSGRDGAKGTTAMKRAGAVVIAESPETAEFPSMPIAAARAGADLVLPVDEIGPVLCNIVDGAPLPAMRPPPPSTTWQAGETDRNTIAPGGKSMDTGDAESLPSPNFTADSSAARAEVAGLRVDELRLRREELAAGRRATAQTVAVARRRATESLRRAQDAEHAARRAARQLSHRVPHP